MDSQPFDKLLNQISDLLQLAYDQSNKTPFPKKEAEITEKLDSLEKQVKEFEKKSQEFVKGTNVSDYTIQAMLGDEKIEDKTKEILKRTEELKNEVQAAAQDLKQASIQARVKGKNSPDSEKKTKSRKGKFRSLGGVKNWKPL